MSNVTISPNMNLPVPNVGQDPGPDWANNINASLSIVDQHNHTPGQGVPIPPSGLNINAPLPFQNNAATGLQAAAFTPQLSLATLNAVYVQGVDLYYNDGSSNVIKLTSGGSVNATSSGISSGTATASFVSSVLVVNAATNTPANIQGASLLLGNNVANSKYLTLSPPNSMAANYGLTLPSIPVTQSIMSIDTSGNIAGSYTVDGSTIAISSNVIGIAPNGVNTTQLANGAVTTAKLSALNSQLGASTGAFGTSSGSLVDVTNATITITTNGNPVWIGLIADGSGLGSTIEAQAISGSSQATFAILRGATLIASTALGNNSSFIFAPSSTLSCVDAPSAGTYTYKVQAEIVFGNSAGVSYSKLFAYEIR